MNLASAKPGDIVLVDKKGRQFHAAIHEKRERELSISPLDHRVNYFTCTAREVVGLWHKSRQRAAVRVAEEARQA